VLAALCRLSASTASSVNVIERRPFAVFGACSTQPLRGTRDRLRLTCTVLASMSTSPHLSRPAPLAACRSSAPARIALRADRRRGGEQDDGPLSPHAWDGPLVLGSIRRVNTRVVPKLIESGIVSQGYEIGLTVKSGRIVEFWTGSESQARIGRRLIRTAFRLAGHRIDTGTWRRGYEFRLIFGGEKTTSESCVGSSCCLSKTN